MVEDFERRVLGTPPDAPTMSPPLQAIDFNQFNPDIAALTRDRLRDSILGSFFVPKAIFQGQEEPTMTEADWLTCTDPGRMLAFIRTNRGDEAGGAVYPSEPLPTPFLVSDRKLRLFACGCCRLVGEGQPCEACDGTGWQPDTEGNRYWCLHCGGDKGRPGTGRTGGLADPRSRRAVDVAERYADGEATAGTMTEAGFEAMDPAATGSNESIQLAVWEATRDQDLNAGRVARHLVRAGANPATQAALLRCVVGNPFRPWCSELDREWADEDSVEADEMVTKTYGSRIVRRSWLTPAAVALARAAYEERLPSGLLDPTTLGVLADELEGAGCSAEMLLAHLREPTPHCHGCHVLDLLLGKE